MRANTVKQRLLEGKPAFGAVPMARVQQNDYGTISIVLDLGALGIVVPMVNSREEAEEAVRATLYAPRGERSNSAIGVSIHAPLPEYVERIRDEVLVIVQIETREAVERAEQILSVDGVDGCMVGPSDLGYSMGVPHWSKEHEAAMERVLQVCRKVGKIPGIAAWGSGTNAPAHRAEQGFLFIQATSDRELVPKGAEEILETIKGFRS